MLLSGADVAEQEDETADDNEDTDAGDLPQNGSLHHGRSFAFSRDTVVEDFVVVGMLKRYTSLPYLKQTDGGGVVC